MPIVTPVPIPPAPPAPQRNDPDTFEERNDAAVEYQFNTLPPALNQVADSAYQNALESQSFAQAATANGLAGANFKGQWADQTGAAAPPYTVFHGGLFWSLLKPIPDVAASQPGPINTDWAVVASPAQYNNFFIGDYIETARDPGPAWLRRDGGRYPVTAYPELAALMPKVPSSFLFNEVAETVASVYYGAQPFLGKIVFWGEAGASGIYSWDGEAWESHGGTGYFKLGFGGVLGDKLVIGGNGGVLRYTEDLEVYTPWDLGQANLVTYVACSPTSVVAVGNVGGASPKILRAASIGGVVSSIAVPAGFIPKEVFYAGGVFYVTPQSGTQCARSIDDGLTFTTFTPPEVVGRVKEVGGKVFGFSQFIGVKDGLWLIEDNFSEYTKLPTNQTGAFYDIAYLDGKYVAAGANGLEWSIDLTSWNIVDDARLIGARIIFELDGALYTIAGGKTFRGIFVDSEIFFVPNDNPVTGWIKAVPDGTGTVGYAGIPEAPINGEVYARQDGTWRSAGEIFEASDTAVAAANTAVAARNEAVPAAATAVSAANDAADTLDVIEGLVGDWPFKLNDLQTHIRNIKYGAGPYPTLDLLFTGATVLDPRITFTRASSATYFDAMGVLRTAAAGEPRFDYDPATGESLGLLVEGQATNLFPRSNNFTAVGWSRPGSSVVQDGYPALDGSSDAWKIVENAESAQHPLQREYTFGPETYYVLSIYAKAGERSVIQLAFGSAAFGLEAYANFDLGEGVISRKGTAAEAYMRPCGSGWYRVGLIARSQSSAEQAIATYLLQTSPTAARFASYSGDGVSGLYVCDAQLEEGSIPTSYIKTEASQVTRSQGAASISVDDFSFNPEAFTFVVRWELKGSGPDISHTPIMKLGDESSTAYRGIGFTQRRNNWNVHFSVRDDNQPSAGAEIIVIPGVQGKNVAAFSFNRSTGQLRASVNGSPVQSGVFPGVFDEGYLRRIFLSPTVTISGSALPGLHIKRCHYQGLTYFPRALPDAELIALSSL